MKSKNRRISALKWGQVDLGKSDNKSSQSFEFLNIAPNTNNASIRDIQKTVSMLWKLETKICLKPDAFRKELAKSLGELRKLYQISYPEPQFKELMDKVRETPVPELIPKIKEYFESENQLGLEINKSLIDTENLPKKQIEHMK